MRNVAAIAACLAVVIFASCKKEEKEKTVTVGEQVGALFTGTAGTATFTVTTENIAAGSAITLNNTVAGISLGTTATTGNSTTVSINTTAATPQGAHSLTLTIGGVTSQPFTLNVGGAKTVKIVGEQVGRLAATVTGTTVTYTVETANIANGSYDATVANRPTGVTVQGKVTIDNNSGTLTLAGSENTKTGTTSTLTLTIDGVTSGAFTLKIDEPVILLEEIQYNNWRYVYEYDDQDRIEKTTRYINGQIDRVDIYKYNAVGDLEEVKYKYEAKPTNNETKTLTRNNNIITIVAVSDTYSEIEIIILNHQGLPENSTLEGEDGSKDTGIYTWNENRNLTKVEWTSEWTGGSESGGNTFTYYDDTKTEFHYCKTPKWVLWKFNGYVGANNIKTQTRIGSSTPTFEYEYVYNEYDLPVEQKQGSNTTTYKYMKR